MPAELNDLEQQQPFDRILAILCGLEKSGKSWLAATGRKPILFFDFDGRAASLAGRKDVFAITFRDPVASHMQPDALNEMLTFISKLEQGENLKQLGFTNAGDTYPKTIVIDSVTTMARAAMNYVTYSNPKDLSRQVNFGGMSVRFAKNFDAWNAEMSTVESVILRLFALKFPEGRPDIICTLHQTEEEDKLSSTQEKKVFTGKLVVFPPRYKLLLKYFNEVWRIEQTPVILGQGSAQQSVYRPRVFTQPNHRFEYAATALDVDPTEDPDIDMMIAKHVARDAAKKSALWQNVAKAQV